MVNTLGRPSLDINFVIPFLVAATSAVLGAMVARILSRRKERFQTTIDLFHYYHSPGMIEARKDAWVYLNGVYLDDPRSFSNLFSDRAEGEHVDRYSSLIKIIYFWYMLWMLHKEGEIAPKLARRMFYFQYGHWRSALMPLYEVTNRCQEDNPEWLPCMREDQMSWIIKP